MLEIIVYCVITLMGLLLLAMYYKVSKLYSTERLSTLQNSETKHNGVTSIKSAQAFAEQQLFDIKKHLEDDKM